MHRIFRKVPLINQLWRYALATKLDLAFAAFKTNCVGKLLRSMIQGSLERYMRRTAPAEYLDILIPDFDFGAKRPILDHGYLEALHKPNVDVVESRKLTVVGPREVRTDGGQTVRVDVIILANGFKTQEFLVPMTLTGRNGATLPGIWQRPGSFASAYMGYVPLTRPLARARNVTPQTYLVSQRLCRGLSEPFLSDRAQHASFWAFDACWY